jgi:ribosomal protein L9
MAVVSIASAAYGAYSQHQQAEQQEEAAEKQQMYEQLNWLAEAEANKDAAQSQVDQLNIKQQQIADSGEQQLTQAEREARTARARAIVASGEMGVSGNLTEGILANLALKHSEEMSAIEGNLGGAMQQTQYEKKEARRRGQTVGSGPANVILSPNLTDAFIEAGLGIAAAGANAYASDNTGTKTKYKKE